MTINVTKTYLPELSDYIRYLRGIWKRNWVTNNGPLVNLLEEKLKKYLGVKHLFFVANGTIGLEIALRALDVKGEVITTPFSYVASTSSIVWMNCKPVFADINPLTLCIDPEKVERAITQNTSAILAVHVYGNPCETEAIGRIARNYKLKVIYDAAHAFGVRYKGKPILKWGDISVLSFHATKIFHTVEGGAVITEDDGLAHKISYLRNFGHKGQDMDFLGLGINGKNTELHAAMGLSILPKIERLIKARKKVVKEYDRLLAMAPLKKPKFSPDATLNYGYYPVIFESEEKLLRVKEALIKNDIFPRRYFWPALHTLNYVETASCPIAERIASKVLCLPLSHDLTPLVVKKISKCIIEGLKK